MRDLLFRVFDLQEKVMSEIISLKDIALSGGIDFNGKDGWYGYKWEVLFDYNPDRFIVEQWTGLYDGTKWEQLTEAERKAWLDKGKTKEEWPGKMIFEGDIVKFLDGGIDHSGDAWECENRGVVTYNDNYPRFYIDAEIESVDYEEIWDDIVVLGNVHEHKHLLEVADGN
jgi:hypothetical protein